MIIEIVAPNDVDKVWPLISEQIVACTVKTPTDMSAGEFWQLCRSGGAYLIIAHDGGTIYSATIWRFQAGLFTALMMVGHDAGLWFKQLVDFASELSRTNGSTGLAFTGRKGLGHLLKTHLGKANIVRHTYFVET